MVQEEFKRFMDQQIIEIEKYKKKIERNHLDVDSNTCVFEWIKKNAKSFYEKWGK